METAFCRSAKAEFLQGIHKSTDTYKCALFTSAASLDSSMSEYRSANEASGPGYEPGGLTLSGYKVKTDAKGTSTLDFANPKWQSATITARGCLIYNASQGNRAIAVYDFGKDISSVNGPFEVLLMEAGGLINIG